VNNEVTFHTGTLADAISRAARVAPTKGEAFDKAAGILLECQPQNNQVVVRATNIEESFRTILYPTTITGEPFKMRIPSLLLDAILQTLPKGDDDKTILIDRGDDKVRIKSGSTVTALQILDPEAFPLEEPIPDFTGVAADQFAALVDQVAWATDKKHAKLSGVHIDGQRIVACNSYCLAYVPCDVRVEQPITAPLGTVRSLLKSASDVRMAPSERKLYIALDEHTVCSTNLIAEEYPNISALMREEFLGTFKFKKSAFMDTMNRVNAVARQDRLPKITLELDNDGLLKQLILDIEVPGVARLRDSLIVETEYDNDFSISFTSGVLESAVENSKSDTITVDFGYPDNPSKTGSIRVTDGTGYTCYAMSRRG